MSRTDSPALSMDAPARHAAVPARLGTILASHPMVDVYAALVPPLIGVLQIRCDLTDVQKAWLLGIGSLSSGLSQPLGAWISDRADSRLFGALGLLMAAVCLSCIGLASSFASLVALFVVGMIGVGVYHPVGASSIGQIADQLPGRRRSLGISFFFVFGMAGGIAGSLIAGQVAAAGDAGFELLRYGLIPGVLVAMALHLCIRRVPHRSHGHHLIAFGEGELARRWSMIVLLYLANAMRFTVNVTLYFLAVLWAEAHVRATAPLLAAEAVVKRGGEIAGLLNALLIVGMAVGGFTAGAMIPKGREKWFLVCVPVLLSPAVMAWGGAGLWGGYLCALLSGIGFASMIPVTLSLGQRLLPHRTSLASGLMLGGAWAVAVVGPRIAQYCLGTLNWDLPQTFWFPTALLLASGLICLPLSGRTLRMTALDDAH